MTRSTLSALSAAALLASTGLALAQTAPDPAAPAQAAPLAPTHPGPAMTMTRSTTVPATATTQATTDTTATTPRVAAPKGSLTMSHGQWRSSQLVGATVYDTAGDSIGTVDDMMLDTKGHVTNVVVSVGGFLGVGDKLVEVPFSKLKTEASKSNATDHDYSLVLPNATKKSLTTMTAFKYDQN